MPLVNCQNHKPILIASQRHNNNSSLQSKQIHKQHYLY